jgi:hypothetical protein
MKFGNEFWLILFREYISPNLFAVCAYVAFFNTILLTNSFPDVQRVCRILLKFIHRNVETCFFSSIVSENYNSLIFSPCTRYESAVKRAKFHKNTYRGIELIYINKQYNVRFLMVKSSARS